MARGGIPSAVGALALLVVYGVAPLVIPYPFFRTAMGDLVPAVILAATIVLTVRNALESRGHTRLFWGLITSGMMMWWVNHAGWVWFEVLARKPIPDPFFGDAFLFLHIVPIMAAVAIRPHRAGENEGTLSSTLNVLILLTWWVVVYAFIVFPDEFIVPNPVYNGHWDQLYLVEELLLIGLSARAFLTSQGAWRALYRAIFLASLLYAVSSEVINLAIARHTYVSGGLNDIPFLASVLGFLWAASLGRAHLQETLAATTGTQSGSALATVSAKLALLSLPVMAYWALFASHAVPVVQRMRFGVAMIGIAALAFFVFFRQQLLDRQLEQLLEQSQSSYNNLQRLQGRVVQQEKLASLGELVALAATELDYPLSAILENTERLSTSGDLRL